MVEVLVCGRDRIEGLNPTWRDAGTAGQLLVWVRSEGRSREMNPRCSDDKIGTPCQKDGESTVGEIVGGQGPQAIQGGKRAQA